MTPPRIVVGVDDSVGARAALGCAFEEARRREARVVVLHAYLFEVAWIDRADLARWSKMERQAAESALAHILEDVSTPTGIEVHARVVEGNPVSVLIQASRDADLLVVGSRGRGGLAGLLLGSVSQRCVERAHCPWSLSPHVPEQHPARRRQPVGVIHSASEASFALRRSSRRGRRLRRRVS